MYISITVCDLHSVYLRFYSTVLVKQPDRCLMFCVWLLSVRTRRLSLTNLLLCRVFFLFFCIAFLFFFYILTFANSPVEVKQCKRQQWYSAPCVSDLLRVRTWSLSFHKTTWLALKQGGGGGRVCRGGGRGGLGPHLDMLRSPWRVVIIVRYTSLTHCLRLATKTRVHHSLPFINLPLLIRPVLSYGGNQ